MEKELLKIHQMLYSNDPELKQLGIIALKEHISEWDEFKRLRGITIEMKSFFPYALKMEIRKLGRELKKNHLKKRNKPYETGRHHKDAQVHGRGDG